MIDLDVLAERFRSLAATSTSRSPLYRQLSERIAEDSSVLRILQSAPDEQAVPVLLFAAVHHLLLGQPDGREELGGWYATIAASPRQDDPYPAFQEFVNRNSNSLRRMVSERHTQTNEVGRTALLLPALGIVEQDVGGPLALIEIGASAGLNLLIDRYAYRYDPGGDIGLPSPVTLHCATRGPVPVPPRLPRIVSAVGLDTYPVNVLDADGVRWLSACVWPDQIDRFTRLIAALDLARETPPQVRRGDAVDDLIAPVRSASVDGHPVVVTSWAMSYLSEARQRRFVTSLDELASEHDLSWISLESPASTTGLPIPSKHPGEDLTVLALTRWRSGRRTVQRLATCHPHGYWIHWETETR